MVEVSRNLEILSSMGIGGWYVSTGKYDAMYVEQLFLRTILEGLACIFQLVDCKVLKLTTM